MAVPLQTCSAVVKPAYIHAGVLFERREDQRVLSTEGHVVIYTPISRLFPVLSGFPCDCDKSVLLDVLGTCNITVVCLEKTELHI